MLTSTQLRLFPSLPRNYALSTEGNTLTTVTGLRILLNSSLNVTAGSSITRKTQITG